MEKKRQPVHEGYLQWLPATASALQLQYCQLSWGCQLRMFPNETIAASNAGGISFSIRGFCKWEGQGVLPLNSYGLELTLKDKKSIFVAAENRLDLERWCRALIAVLDPNSDAAEEIKRERRKVKREIRKQAEKEAEIKAQEEEFKRKWIAQKKEELRARELEIEQMTPLQRKDGLGTLDEETEAILRERKKRLNKKAGQNVGRVGKQVQRRRIELLAGGKVVNEDAPTSFGYNDANTLVQRKNKVKIDLPPPGQYFMAVGDREVERFNPRQSASSQGSSVVQEEDVSTDDTMYSAPRNRAKSKGTGPPPPPPPPPPVANLSNPMAAALEAIKMNRRFSNAIPVEDDDEVLPPRRSTRARDSQLSAEGKSLLARALSGKENISQQRKGLFDSSDEEEDDEPEDEAAPSHNAAQTMSIPAVLTVVYLSATVELRQGKSVGIYRYALHLAEWRSEFGYSYHEMETLHGALKQCFPDGLPKFPSKHLLRNPTKPENMQKRAAEFLVYFQTLTQIPVVVRHPAFHSAYRIPSSWISSLTSGIVQATPPPTLHAPPDFSNRPKAMAPMPRTRPQVPKKNLFDEDSSGDEDETSIVSVETPKPVFTKHDRPSTSRPTRSLSAASASSVRSMRNEVEHQSSRKQMQLDSRPPSRKNVNQAVPGLPANRPNPFAGGRVDLMAAIRQGAKLNKVSQDSDDEPSVHSASVSKPPPTNSLLDALKHAPQLKKTTSVMSTPEPTATPPLAAPSIHNSIANAMAARQIHTQCFSTASRGPKAVRRSAQAARRATDKAEQNALQATNEAPAPAEYQAPPQYSEQPTFGQVMKSNFLWGAGMSLGFIFIGSIFRVFMEEAPESENEWEGAVLMKGQNDCE